MPDVSEEPQEHFLQTTPLLKVHGLRRKYGQMYAAQLAETLGKANAEDVFLKDLQAFSFLDLESKYGHRMAHVFFQVSRGLDYKEVAETGPPKSILVELSWPAVDTDLEVYDKMRPLIEDLLHRIVDDARRHDGRYPSKYYTKWRRTEQLLTG